eukprot:5169868-Amphidinium_carterae.1
MCKATIRPFLHSLLHRDQHRRRHQHHQRHHHVFSGFVFRLCSPTDLVQPPHIAEIFWERFEWDGSSVLYDSHCKATGNAASKAVTSAEVIKRRFK